MTLPADGPTRVRLTAPQRRWLVAQLYDMIWDTDLMSHGPEVGSVEEMLAMGPNIDRIRQMKVVDAAMANELLDKLDYHGGREYAEALLVYTVEGSAG